MKDIEFEIDSLALNLKYFRDDDFVKNIKVIHEFLSQSPIQIRSETKKYLDKKILESIQSASGFGAKIDLDSEINKSRLEFLKQFEQLNILVNTKNFLIDNLFRIQNSIYEIYIVNKYNISPKEYKLIRHSVDLIQSDPDISTFRYSDKKKYDQLIAFRQDYDKHLKLLNKYGLLTPESYIQASVLSNSPDFFATTAKYIDQEKLLFLEKELMPSKFKNLLEGMLTTNPVQFNAVLTGHKVSSEALERVMSRSTMIIRHMLDNNFEDIAFHSFIKDKIAKKDYEKLENMINAYEDCPSKLMSKFEKYNINLTLLENNRSPLVRKFFLENQLQVKGVGSKSMKI